MCTRRACLAAVFPFSIGLRSMFKLGKSTEPYHRQAAAVSARKWREGNQHRYIAQTYKSILQTTGRGYTYVRTHSAHKIEELPRLIGAGWKVVWMCL